MTAKTLLREMHEGITTITFNRPEHRNGITNAMIEQMAAALEEVEHSDEVKALILTGAGRDFSVGADYFREPKGEGTQQPGRVARVAPIGYHGLFARRLYELRKPSIAAINGMCAGVALSFALGCSIRFASENARFCSVFVRRALVASSGGTFLLPRVVGAANALELMWTGDTINAQEALRIGLISRVVPQDQLMAVTREFAMRLAGGPSLSIELTKRLADQALETNDLVADLSAEAWAQAQCQASEDFKEGVQSFQQKRQPEFKGR